MTAEKSEIVVRFAGDSGDGIQFVGTQFTKAAALLAGNDVHTFPDFPAEIRAPAGTLAGVSGFQVRLSDAPIHTAGDLADVLVVMNPAGLKKNSTCLKEGALIVLNDDQFSEREIAKAGYEYDPLKRDDLSACRVLKLPINTLTLKILEDNPLSRSQKLKSKNMWVLGVIYWLFNRELSLTLEMLEKKFGTQAQGMANQICLKAGYAYAEASELFTEQFTVKKACLPQGRYRQLTGNEALALGCIVAAQRAERTLFLSSYPITPASSVLHAVTQYRDPKVKTFQAEDEIAAMSASLGAAFGGSLAVTITSGPGMDLKNEAIGLGVMAELPVVIINIQRAGPSTGMPTKTEQSDLLQALYGRHGESPLPVLAASSPGDCFHIVLEAFEWTMRYQTPVILLSDGYLSNGAEPWRVPDVDTLPNFTVVTSQKGSDNPMRSIPGMKDRQYQIGGLERDIKTGSISYESNNHQIMTDRRAQKIKTIQAELPSIDSMNHWLGASSGDILVIAWGGTHGTVLTAVEGLLAEGQPIAYLHLRCLNPLPIVLKDLIYAFKRVWVPELNNGQLSKILREKFLVDVVSYTKVTGQPFTVGELLNEIQAILEDTGRVGALADKNNPIKRGLS